MLDALDERPSLRKSAERELVAKVRQQSAELDAARAENAELREEIYLLAESREEMGEALAELEAENERLRGGAMQKWCDDNTFPGGSYDDAPEPPESKP